MTDSRAKQQSKIHATAAQQAANMTVNMPILAYSSQEDHPDVGIVEMGNDSAGQQVLNSYNIQVQDNPPSKLSTGGNVTDFVHIQHEQSQSLNSAQPPGGGQKSRTSLARNDSPDRIFDPKPPNLTGSMPTAKHPAASGNESNSGAPQPVQNVFQFNVRVNNNNMQPGGILVSNEGCSQRNLRPNQQQSAGNPAGQTYSNTGASGKSRSKERRPMSSKHQNNSSKHHIPWQNQSYGHQNPTNPYFGSNTRKLVKKRPQSATKKNLMQGALLAKHNQTNQAALSFKSPQTNFTVKKGSLSRGGGYDGAPNSLPSQKQQRLAQYNMHHTNHTGGGILTSNELLSSADHSNQGLVHVNSAQGNTQANVPLIAAANFHPYNRSMKTPSQHVLNSTAKSGKSAKQHHPTTVFGSPDKVTRQLKSKIPTMTLQSREDLYEQNMHTKMQINNLRNENRKINTKLVVLENQLAQKDKLFEDMYKAAFQQVRFPQAAANAPQSQATPQSSGNVFHPAGQTMTSQHAMSMGSSYGPTAGAQGKQSLYSVNAAPMSSSQQQHAQAQQLINSYKRTIREQSRELDKRDVEIEQIKRSVKMTQINQVLVENETYRKECIRLRENLEQAIWQNQQLNKNTANARQQQASTLEMSAGATNPQPNSATNNGSPRLLGRNESATETFQRDHTSPLRETNLGGRNTGDDLSATAAANEQLLKDENSALQQRVMAMEESKIEQLNQIESIKTQLLDAKRDLDRAQIEAQTKLETQEQKMKAIQDEMRQKQEAEMQALQEQHAKEAKRLNEEIKKQIEQKAELQQQKQAAMAVAESGETIEEDEEVRTLEQQLEVSKQAYKDLEKEFDPLVMRNQKAVSELRTVESQNEILLTKLKQNEAKLKSNQVEIEKRTKQAEQRIQMVNELEEQKEELEAKVADLQTRTGAYDEFSAKLKAAERQIEFKQNEIEAQKYDYEKRLAEQDKLIQMLKQNNYQSPPIPNHEVNRRRSTKTKSQKLNSHQSDSAFGDGDSSFQRADESEAPYRNQPRASEADRSDLGFTSNDDSEPMPMKNSQEAVAEPKPQWKIQVNDKTVFGPDGLPLSPKEINSDSPNVREGLARLRNACMVHFIRHDSIENYLYGNDYRPESKLSIRQTKEAAIEKLGMEEMAALDFARFLHEQNGQSVSYDEADANASSTGVFIDQSRTTQAMKIMLFVVQQVQGEIVYFRPDKEEKMKLIIGEKLQEAQMKTKLLNSISRHSKKEDQTTFEQLCEIFEQARFNFDKATMQCCFIFLLKKRQDGNLLRIRKSDLINFIHQSSGKAADFTLTGSKFPLETDLMYSSSDDDEQMPQDKDFRTEEEGRATLKSADAVQKVGQALASKVQERASDPTTYKPAQQAQAPPQPAGQAKQHLATEAAGDDYSSDDDFGANDSRSEYSGHPQTQAKRQSMPIQAAQLGSEEESDDDFGANDSRSEYSKPASKKTSNLNSRGSIPQVKPGSKMNLGVSSSDGDFGANDSRSEYSAAKIPEDIAGSASDERPKDLLAVQEPKSGMTIEDSINDRDLESSVARVAMAVTPPLTKVPEVEENKEVTIETKDHQPQQLTNNQSLQLENTTGQNIAQLHVQLQKSRSFPPQASQEDNRLEEAPVDKAKQPLQHQKTDMDGRNFSTVPNLGKGKVARKRPMINIDISTVKSQIGKKSINSNSNKSQGGGIINLKPMPAVEVGNVEGASDATSKGGQIISPTAADSFPAVVLQPLKEEAPVPFGITVHQESQSEASPSPPPRKFTEDKSVEQIDNAYGVPQQQNAVTKFDQVDSGDIEEDYEEGEEDLPLVQLKPEVPVPFGISVNHVEHSQYGGSVDGGAKIDDEMPDDDYEEDDDLEDLPLEALKPEVPVPFGVTVAHVQHSEYGGSVDDGARDEKAKEDDPLLQGSVSSGLELAPLKEQAPIPVGIRVDHVKHSEYGGDSVDQYSADEQHDIDITADQIQVKDQAIKDNLAQDSISSGIELAPLKSQQPIPLGIHVNHMKHSEYGGSVEGEKNAQSQQDLQEDSQSSGIELAPLKPEVALPIGIKVNHVQHSEYGGGNQSDPEDKEKDLNQAAKTTDSEEYSEAEEADKVEAPTSPPTADQDPLKSYFKPKVTETNTVKVEPLATVSSEEGFELPSVKDVSRNSTPLQSVEPEEVKKIEATLPQVPASAVNLNRLNDSINDLGVPPESAAKFTNDSFGQGSQGIMSAGKRQQHFLPPLELLALKEEEAVPGGIKIGELMTDRSHANTSAAKQTDQDNSQVELRMQNASQINDFKAADKDSEDYTEDEEEIPETLESGKAPAQMTPEGLKKAMKNGDGNEPSEIKNPPQIDIDGGDSNSKQGGAQSEIEEDYEF